MCILEVRDVQKLASYGVLLNPHDPTQVIDNIIWVVENGLTPIDPQSRAHHQYGYAHMCDEDRTILVNQLRDSFVQQNAARFRRRKVEPQGLEPVRQEFGKLVEDNIRLNLQAWMYLEGLVRVSGDYLPFIKEMIVLGSQTQQPLLVYLAEKVALLAGQVIPHHLAVQASEFLALNKDQPPLVLARAKEALAMVGGVDRERIYDPRQDYRHILVRKEMMQYLLAVRQHVSGPMDPYIDALLDSNPVQWTKRPIRNSQLLAGIDHRLNAAQL